MTFPTIHLNGTSVRDLRLAYLDAYVAVDNAFEKLCGTAPNGRDYYPQGAQAMDSALAEHAARLKKLRDVYEELQALIVHCDEEDRT